MYTLRIEFNGPIYLLRHEIVKAVGREDSGSGTLLSGKTPRADISFDFDSKRALDRAVDRLRKVHWNVAGLRLKVFVVYQKEEIVIDYKAPKK